MAKQNGYGAGYEEEHGASEDEAVRDPSVVEEAGSLSIERAEETLDPAHRSLCVKDARVA